MAGVVLPQANRQDVNESLGGALPPGLDVHYAVTMDDVLKVALPVRAGIARVCRPLRVAQIRCLRTARQALPCMSRQIPRSVHSGWKAARGFKRVCARRHPLAAPLELADRLPTDLAFLER